MKPSANAGPPLQLRPARHLSAAELEQWVREHAGQRWDAEEYLPRQGATEDSTRGQAKR
jgi:hypothetical protein